MSRLISGLFVAATLCLIGGGVWLAVSDIHPTPQTVHKTLPRAAGTL